MSNNLNYCPYCGKKLFINAKFCHNCGEMLPVSVPSNLPNEEKPTVAQQPVRKPELEKKAPKPVVPEKRTLPEYDVGSSWSCGRKKLEEIANTFFGTNCEPYAGSLHGTDNRVAAMCYLLKEYFGGVNEDDEFRYGYYKRDIESVHCCDGCSDGGCGGPYTCIDTKLLTIISENEYVAAKLQRDTSSEVETKGNSEMFRRTIRNPGSKRDEYCRYLKNPGNLKGRYRYCFLPDKD